MGFRYRFSRSTNSFGWEAGLIVRRVLISAVVVLIAGRLITGEWLLWLAAFPAAYGLWKLVVAVRRNVRYLRGRSGWPGPVAPRWWRAMGRD